MFLYFILNVFCLLVIYYVIFILLVFILGWRKSWYERGGWGAGCETGGDGGLIFF